MIWSEVGRPYRELIGGIVASAASRVTALACGSVRGSASLPAEALPNGARAGLQ